MNIFFRKDFLKNLFTKTLFSKLFVSYTTFLMVPTFVFLILFLYNTATTMEKQISQSNMERLRLIQNKIELMMDGILRDAIKTSTNDSVEKLNSLDKSSYYKNERDVFNIIDVYDVLKKLEQINHNIHSVYLYSSELNRIITSKGEFILKDDFDDTLWIEEYQKNHSRIQYLSARIPDNRRAKENTLQNTPNKNNLDYVVTLVYPLAMYSAQSSGAIAINLYEKNINISVTPPNYSGSGSTFIINKSGFMIANNNTEDLGVKLSKRDYISTILNSTDTNSYFVTSIENKKYLVTYSKSTVNDWIYVNLSTLSNLFDAIYNLKSIFIFITILLCAFGILFSYFYSKRTYKPLKIIMENLRLNTVIDGDSDKDELFILSGVINNFINDEKKLSQTLTQNLNSLKHAYILDLVYGNISEKNDSIKFFKPLFMCIVISIDNFAEFSKKYSAEEQSYIKLIVLQVSEKISNIYVAATGVILQEDKLCLVLNLEEMDAHSARSITNNIFNHLQKELSAMEGLSVTMGVGNLYNGERNVSVSYSEAIDSVKHKMIVGCGKLIYFSDLELLRGQYYYPAKKINHVMNYLKLNSMEGVQNTLEELICELKEKKELDYDNVMHIFNQLVRDTINYLSACNISTLEIFESESGLFKSLASIETLDEINAWLKKFYREIITYNERNEMNDKKYMLRIVELINERFTRFDLDITQIADELGLSYSHLRKIFKDNMNINFVDYINSVRMNEAKKLLLTTDMTTEKIAEKSGYSAYQSFYRTFKKLEGITPGEYRQINKQLKT